MLFDSVPASRDSPFGVETVLLYIPLAIEMAMLQLGKTKAVSVHLAPSVNRSSKSEEPALETGKGNQEPKG